MKHWLLLLFIPLLLAACKKDSPSPAEENPSGNTVMPVIFHVLYDNPGSSIQSPPAAVFTTRIGQMNRFYAATLFTSTSTPGVPSQKVDISFTLATHDPQGNLLQEPGIQRYYYAGSSNMDPEQFLDKNRTLAQRDKDILWDPNQYINIWLFGFQSQGGQTETTGITYLPYSSSAHPLVKLAQWDGAFSQLPDYMHGVTLNNNFFQQDEGAYTLFHEMGHYVGLLHAFDENGGCTDPDNASDDGCSDTPVYDRPAYQQKLLAGTLPYPSQYRQPCDGSPLFISTNIMDYFNGYRNNLTPQQQSRIGHVLSYSPWIPRSDAASRSLTRGMVIDPNEKRPDPILMR